MRTTVDLPDDLFRRAKVEAALQGRTLKDLLEEGLRLMLDKDNRDGASGSPAGEPRRIPSLHDLMRDVCGTLEDGPADLSTNPKYLDDFGR